MERSCQHCDYWHAHDGLTGECREFSPDVGGCLRKEMADHVLE